MKMPGFGADIPDWGAIIHRCGAQMGDSGRDLLQDFEPFFAAMRRPAANLFAAIAKHR
jgi:hypothetical protein